MFEIELQTEVKNGNTRLINLDFIMVADPYRGSIMVGGEIFYLTAESFSSVMEELNKQPEPEPEPEPEPDPKPNPGDTETPPEQTEE